MKDKRTSDCELEVGMCYPDEQAVRQLFPKTDWAGVVVVSVNGQGVQVVRLKCDIKTQRDWDNWLCLVAGARNVHSGKDVTVITSVPPEEVERFNAEVSARAKEKAAASMC
jgi:hypothetical protein